MYVCELFATNSRCKFRYFLYCDQIFSAKSLFFSVFSLFLYYFAKSSLQNSLFFKYLYAHFLYFCAISLYVFFSLAFSAYLQHIRKASPSRAAPSEARGLLFKKRKKKESACCLSSQYPGYHKKQSTSFCKLIDCFSL